MALSTEVKTPDFEACMVQNDTNNSAMKPLRFSKKGLSVSTTSAPASLFNSPETLQSPLNESLTSCHELIPYTQHLEETVIEKYAAVKEVFNNLSGDETESSESRPSSPLSPPIIPAFPARNIHLQTTKSIGWVQLRDIRWNVHANDCAQYHQLHLA